MMFSSTTPFFPSLTSEPESMVGVLKEMITVFLSAIVTVFKVSEIRHTSPKHCKFFVQVSTLNHLN